MEPLALKPGCALEGTTWRFFYGKELTVEFQQDHAFASPDGHWAQVVTVPVMSQDQRTGKRSFKYETTEGEAQPGRVSC